MGVGGSLGPHKIKEWGLVALVHVQMYLHAACVSKLMCLLGEGPHWQHVLPTDMRLKIIEALLAQALAAAVTSWPPLEHHGVKAKD